MSVSGARFRRALVNAFVVSYMFAVGVWLAPEDWPLRERALTVVRPHTHALGLNQGWHMFAPNPPRGNSEVLATLRFADGSERTYPLSGLHAMGQLERTQKWRLRKWQQRLQSTQEPRAWEDAARHMVARHATPAQPVVAVALRRRTAPIQVPGQPRAPDEATVSLVTICSFEIQEGAPK